MDRKQKVTSSIMGLVVADARGVPVEFCSRAELQRDPVMDMRSYGTHFQLAGTWSDDSSMMIATMEWLTEGAISSQKLDYGRLMDKFARWLNEGEYTPYGRAFDSGIATRKAIYNYECGREPLECGGKGSYDNGNGSLMRILPAAFWSYTVLREAAISDASFIYEMSSLTHAHARSKVGCLIYSKILADMLRALCECHEGSTVDSNDFSDDGEVTTRNKISLLQSAADAVKAYLQRPGTAEDILHEVQVYERVWDMKKLSRLPENEIKSSGYVLHTLEAALWCFLTTDSYKECVLRAVNLGDDTDTVGAVAGGIAGLYYGMEQIPENWLEMIPKKEWILDLAEKLAESI